MKNQAASIGCDSCHAPAVFWFGQQPLCYFCARQKVFDLHRAGEKVPKLVQLNPKAKF